MSDYDKNKDLDQLLDSALAQYSSAEPRLGFETRILARVREASAARGPQWGSWRWLWAGAVAAIAVVTFVLLANRRSVVPRPEINVVQAPQSPVQLPPQVQSSASVITNIPQKHWHKMHMQLRPEPVALTLKQRPGVFPTPTPLSEQERLLLSYYARTPREELIAQSHPDEPPVSAEDQSNVAAPDQIFVPPKSSNTR